MSSVLGPRHECRGYYAHASGADGWLGRNVLGVSLSLRAPSSPRTGCGFQAQHTLLARARRGSRFPEVATILFALEPEDLERFAIPIAIGIAALVAVAIP